MRRQGARPAPPPATRWVAPLLVLALTAAVYWPATGHQFLNWDDDQNFLKNQNFRGLGTAQLRWMFTTFHLNHYHPLTWFSLGLDYTMWGLDPSGFHLTNLALHTANAVLFYWIGLRVLAGRRWAAALAALFFSVHPLRVESVAWVSERRDVLSGLFYLLAALAYLKAQQEGPRTRWMVASLAAFAAALLSKVIVVSLPVALLALDYVVLRRSGRQVWLEKLPYAALAAAAAMAALGLQREGVGGSAEHVAALPALRAGLSALGLAFYLWKTILPVGLYPQYVVASDIAPGDGRVLASAGAVAATTIVAAALRRRWPAGAAAWGCYVASLLPVLSILRVDPQQYVADHHSYLATLPLALLAAAAVARLPARAAAVTGVAVAAALAALAHRQVGVWRDSVTLWTHTLAGSPDSVVAHNNLGEALAADDRLEEAIGHFERAVAIKPNHAHAHYNLGQARQKLGQVEAAVGHYRRAIEVEPGFAAAHNDLANCYAVLGRLDAALEHYRQALAVQPGFADAHYNLGNLLQRERRFDQAIEHYRQALAVNPARADAHNNWGVALDTVGRGAEAVEHYRQALAIDPQNADAHNNLGISLEAAGQREQAAAHYREALRFNPAHPDARANLVRVEGRR